MIGPTSKVEQGFHDTVPLKITGAFFKSHCAISGVAFQRFLRTSHATY